MYGLSYLDGWHDHVIFLNNISQGLTVNVILMVECQMRSVIGGVDESHRKEMKNCMISLYMESKKIKLKEAV